MKSAEFCVSILLSTCDMSFHFSLDFTSDKIIAICPFLFTSVNLQIWTSFTFGQDGQVHESHESQEGQYGPSSTNAKGNAGQKRPVEGSAQIRFDGGPFVVR